MTLRVAHREAMRLAGIEDTERASITFDVFAGDEELFTITVRIPHSDRRKLDVVEQGMGVTLPEALTHLRDRLRSSGLLATP